MNAVVIEHVALNELPDAWRARLPMAANARVTVRIEEETAEREAPSAIDHPLFGIWRDRQETEDVPVYARKLRTPRYSINDPHRED
ncbi:MAG: hypothetical protein ACTHL1_12160 [Burkholderiaceae bacterium]